MEAQQWEHSVNTTVTTSCANGEASQRATCVCENKCCYKKYSDWGAETYSKWSNIELGKGRFRKLAPVKGDDGISRVGSRLWNFVSFTHDGKMPKILPTDHWITFLLMRHSHQFSYAGLDGTLSRFYAKGYWAVRAGHLARTIKNRCVTCRKINEITIFKGFYVRQTHQIICMGLLPARIVWSLGDVNPRAVGSCNRGCKLGCGTSWYWSRLFNASCSNDFM